MMRFFAGLRLAARSLGRARAFCVTVVASWGLAFAAHATMFSIADEVFFQPPRFVRDPDDVLRIYRQSRRQDRADVFSGSFAYRTLRAVSSATSPTADVAAYGSQEATLALAGGGNPIRVGLASQNFFSVLGTVAALGRLPRGTSLESGEGRAVAALSWELWQSRFAGDASVIGRTIQIHD